MIYFMSNERDSINRISYKIQGFEWVTHDRALFRCPLCGDSKKDPNKKRGSFFSQGGPFMFGCFNCDNDGQGVTTYRKFLEKYDPSEYEYMRIGHLRSSISNLNMSRKTEPEKKKHVGSINELFESSIFSNLKSLEELHPDHEAREYVRGRRIPKQAFPKLYYTYDFARFAMEANPNLMEKDKKSGEGLIIPLISPDGTEFGYQCRFFEGKIRYLTHMLNANDVKSFGLNWVKDGDINVTEGALDSFYLPNCIASLDGSLHGTCNRLSEVYGIDKSRFILWFDFEPGNGHVMKNKRNAVEEGYRVAFVNRSDAPYKDINEIVKNARDPIASLKKLRDNAQILSGFPAQLQFQSTVTF